jgi:adenosylcobinamide kinase / adenosylcobinamide-phosphate guanylyltransferase
VGEVTLLVGGARSGKSNLSVEIGQRHPGAVVFIATAEPFDDDLRQRIDRHQAERPDWPTVEEPVDLAAAIERACQTSAGSASAAETLLIIDCLTVWVGNLFFHEPTAEQRTKRYTAAIAALRSHPGPCVVVTNEVGMGTHPDHATAREYRDELGRLNQAVADIAQHALLLVAGRAVRLESPWDLL